MAKRKSVKPTERDRDPGADFKAYLGAIGKGFIAAARFCPVFIYFFIWWNFKERIRRALQLGALTFLSISLIVLWIEVGAELAGASQVAVMVKNAFLAEWLALVLLSLSVFVLLFHHATERRHKHSEFVLGERVWEFMETRHTQPATACVRNALRLFHDVFDRHSVCHVSLWQTSGDALEIASDHVYPPETDPSYFPKLPINDGVAGLVFTDSQPRYVPRLFAPINGKRQIPFVSSFFGHAMKFEIRQSDGGRLEVVNPKMDLNAFKSGAPNERFTFKSFVSVPVVPVGAKNPIGVLNFDFDATDPLSTVDVKTAVFLALLLGDELQRLHADVTPS